MEKLRDALQVLSAISQQKCSPTAFQTVDQTLRWMPTMAIHGPELALEQLEGLKPLFESYGVWQDVEEAYARCLAALK